VQGTIEEAEGRMEGMRMRRRRRRRRGRRAS
jgi:hypothetical protein